MTVSRGTSNGNANGSSYARAARRAWLVQTYRANMDVIVTVYGGMLEVSRGSVAVGTVPTCRCYRCGMLLIDATAYLANRPSVADMIVQRLMRHHVTVDRIIPGCEGGTYRRNNIRPACSGCNSETGGATRARGKRRG